MALLHVLPTEFAVGMARGTPIGRHGRARSQGRVVLAPRRSRDRRSRDSSPARGQAEDRVEATERRIAGVFRFSVLVKGIDGALELLGGLLLLVIQPSSLSRVVRWATAHELAPNGFVARELRAASRSPRGIALYAAVYLLAHGVVKLVLVVEVLRGRLWAYVGMVVVVGGFVAYQAGLVLTRPSGWLAVLTSLDVVVVLLTLHEYRRRRAARTAPAGRPTPV